jgi:topoisomerase IV subunit B
MGSPADSPNSTHDWSRDVDTEHLQRIRQDPAVFAPGGLTHLVLEVLAYVADEAVFSGDPRTALTLHRDGSVSVADHGRGTSTRVDSGGKAVRKPVMTTKDLRFFDSPGVARLPDGHPRRGISVVSALSEWLVHTNRRQDGAWTQRYGRGVPISGLTPLPGDGTTGTTVRFLPDRALITCAEVAVSDLRRFAADLSPPLIPQITDLRGVRSAE